MDWKIIIPMIAGTITRGVMWVFAYIALKLGIEVISDDTGKAIGNFVAAGIVVLTATAWSWYKNQKLLKMEPPK